LNCEPVSENSFSVIAQFALTIHWFKVRTLFVTRGSLWIQAAVVHKESANDPRTCSSRCSDVNREQGPWTIRDLFNHSRVSARAFRLSLQLP